MSRPERPLRIAMLTHSVNPRGGVVHALELGEALQREGHRVTAIAAAHPGQSFFRDVACSAELAPTARPVEGASLVESVGLRIDAVTRHLRALVSRQPFDVFHAQDSITGNALASLVEEGSIKGFVRTVHHLDDFADPQLAAWQRRAHESAEQVFCVSQLWCDQMRIDHAVDAALVHNGVNLARYGAQPHPADQQVAGRYGLHSGSPMVLLVGGIEERKNAVGVLRAFRLLRRVHRHAQLVIAGGATLLDHDAYGRQWRAEMARSGLQQGIGRDVVVTGAVDDAAMPALYRLADVLAMPSMREGFGLAAIEALASGTPVVVSRIAPFTEYLADDDVAWADPVSAESIAEGLRSALKGRGERQIASAASLCQRFNWAASAARHAGLYRQHADRLKPGATISRPHLTTPSSESSRATASGI